MLTIDPHSCLEAVAFFTEFPAPLGQIQTPGPVMDLLKPGATAPFGTDDVLRLAVRDLLRAGGFKPTGRSKPASEYLIRAVEEGRLGSINLAVDICNAVSLHSGLPISVVDVGLADPPYRIGVCPVGTEYVFNPTGQSIDIGGLVSFWDAAGPCAGPVKDSQRTKTSADTRRTISVVWGTSQLPGRAVKVAGWYRSLLEEAGAKTEGC